MSYSIDLNQFFPLRTNETTSNRTQIVTDSLAVLGQLPASSLLHYALNHLATVDETGHVLILTSNRLALKESLLELKDDSFSASLTPDLIAALDRIEIKSVMIAFDSSCQELMVPIITTGISPPHPISVTSSTRSIRIMSIDRRKRRERFTKRIKPNRYHRLKPSSTRVICPSLLRSSSRTTSPII